MIRTTPVTHRVPTLVLFLGLLLLILWFAGPARAERPVNETRPLNPGGTLEISNVAGSVIVLGGAGQVEISGTLGDDVEELEITGGGDHLEIRVKTPRNTTRDMNLESHLTVRAPGDADLKVQTVSSSITVEDMNDRLELQSVSGEIQARTRPRVLSAQTVSGTIHTIGALERTKVQSVSSKIELGEISGRLEASSVSGGISITGGSLEEADLSSVSGDVEISTSLPAGADLSINSHSGAVTLDLGGSASASFDVTTFSGDIDNELTSDTAESTSEYAPGKSLEFSIGGGSARVDINSFSGDVTIR
jgi:DUF4097 and DUF4098 domain-containing protein YvlB